MLAGSVLKSLPVGIASLLQHQQLRFSRKSFRLRDGFYGVDPLVSDDDFEQAKEANLLEDLSYKQVRFSVNTEYNSPLFDRDYERFIRYCMTNGRKQMFQEILHTTMANIKFNQYRKLQKLKEKQGQGKLMTLEFLETLQNKQSAASENEEEAEDQARPELNPLTILKTALANVEPLLICNKVKRGGATYQVPYPLDKKRSEYYALKWMIKAVIERPKPRTKHFPEVLAQELLDAYNHRGKVIKRRDDMHRLADANKAYAHYRWG